MPFTSSDGKTNFTDVDLWDLKQALAAATTPVVPPVIPPQPTPPHAWPVSGYTCIDLPWANNYNNLLVGMVCEDRVIIRFLVPAGTTGAGSIALAEYASAPIRHYAVISETPGDFNGGLSVPPYNASYGNSLSWSFQVGGSSQAWVLLLKESTYYYLNLRNTDQYGTLMCSHGQNCTMFLDLRIPQ